MMVADLSREITIGPNPGGYTLDEAKADWEFAAKMFRFTATYDGEEVASCTGRLFEDLAAPGGGPVGQLGFVGTDEAHRGRGLARSLVKLSLQRLREWRASECILTTGLENTPALRAYENAGFERRYNLNKWSKDLPIA
jgi:ribosomal protein S18 acetylase RimI-like enzyme